MIANNRISAVLVSTDLKRSQAFYENNVGLTLSPETIKNHLLFECGDGTTLLVYGRDKINKADHTQVRLWSTDIDKDVAELAANGIKFDEYDTETFKTIDHVVTSPGIGRSAWFKDPDGNTIAVFQPE
jgi:predicted enzyme related to lactoylglutathione lyase